MRKERLLYPSSGRAWPQALKFEAARRAAASPAAASGLFGALVGALGAPRGSFGQDRLVYVKKFSKAALSALFKGLSRAISPLASALSSALALVLNLAFILAFLGAAAFSGQARADCQETSASADAAIEESRARYEYRGSFPDPAQTAQALDDCLSGLVGYPIDLSLDLGPLPNLSEITDRVCREARQAALNKIPLKTPVFVRAWIMKSAILSPTLPARIRKALE